MSRWLVSLNVIYTAEVDAEDEEDAIEKVVDDCPYDVDGEPYAEQIKEQKYE